MNCKQWQRSIQRAVYLLELGRGNSLHSIALRLQDADIARESLMLYLGGGEDDTLLDLVSVIIERKGGHG